VAVARDAGAVAERLRHRFADDIARVFGGVMKIDVKIADRPQFDVDQAVLGQLFEHVIEKPDAGRYFGGAAAVEVDPAVDLAQLGRQLRIELTGLSQRLVQAHTIGIGPLRQRLFSALDIQPKIRDPQGAKALPVGQATVRLEGVSFSYGDETIVLDDLSLEAKRGEIVALVGPSGGGKTTVLNLIPRFYDVTGGKVTIDDHDVRDITIASLAPLFAELAQNPRSIDIFVVGTGEKIALLSAPVTMTLILAAP